MAFFIQISIYWVILWVLSKFAFKEKLQSHSLKARIAFSVGFLIVGIMHIASPSSLSYMIEGFLPYSVAIVVITGVVEIILALFFPFRKWSKITGWAIIIYLIAIFPANINVAVNHLNAPGGLPSTPFYIWSRLFFQPLYILWVYYSAINLEKTGGANLE